MISRNGRVVAVAALLTAASGLAGCKPTYPKCESDDHCKEKGEVCVNQACQECRDDTQCQAKYTEEARECVNGRCDPKPECRTDDECASAGEGMVCRDEHCVPNVPDAPDASDVPECTADSDCAEGNSCQANRCVATSECDSDAACGPGRFCTDGKCEQGSRIDYTNVSSTCRPLTTGPNQLIALDSVMFAFDRYELDIASQKSLDGAAECLRQAPQVQVVVEGHCDERGTQEYNMALGEKRASTVVDYLRNLGIDVGRMKTRSKGENEPLCTESTEACWARNRRVQFIQSLSN